jgi:hypothetical protein
MARFVKEVGRNYNQFTPEDGPGSGTVTSVGMSVPTGLSITGTPITSSGVLALSYAAGYAIPTTVKQSNWDDAYTFVAAFPTQTGNSGKYLTTNGSTLSWDAININNLTGTLSVAKGGTGATTLTGVLIGNGTSAFTAVTGGPNQILRVNGTATGYEFYTASFLTNPMTLNFDMIYQSGGVPARLAGPTSTTKQFLTAVGNGTATTSLGWGTIATSDIPSAALTRTNDTNVQITLGGTPNSSLLQAVSLTMGWTGQLAVGRGGTGASTLTGVVIGNATSAMTAVAGTAGQFLRRNTTNTAYEFRTLQGSDIAGSELTFANDTNVTMTLGGTPASSLLQPVSINLGWTGQLAVSRGGTGASTLTGVLVGNGTSAISAITGTANQILRRNATNTAYEFWTANYMTNPMTLEGSIIYATTGGTPTQLFANSTGTRKYLSQINGTAPTWETVAGGGGVSGSGTANRIPKWATTTSLTDSLIVDNGSIVTVYGLFEYATSQAGSGVALMYSTNTDTTAAIAHQSKFGTQNLGGGIGRTLLYAASNTTGVTRGELAILSENGGGILANIGTSYTASDYALSVFNIAGTEMVRLNTSGQSFLNGGNVLFGTNGFYYDATNKRLGVGVASPSQVLDLSSAFGVAKITSSTGTNSTFFQFTNTAGTLSIGQEGSTGITFGATAYASVIAMPANRNLEIFQGSFRAVQLLDTGQWKFNDYTSTTSFPGTAAGYLAFTSSGDIITVAAPGGSSGYYRISFGDAIPNTWSNMPSTLQFFDSSAAFITVAELTAFTQVRLLINKLGTSGATNSKIYLRYSTTYSQTASSYSAIGTSSVELAINQSNQFLETAWINLATGAKADVFIALVGDGGDSAADPVFGMIAAEFR